MTSFPSALMTFLFGVLLTAGACSKPSSPDASRPVGTAAASATGTSLPVDDDELEPAGASDEEEDD